MKQTILSILLILSFSSVLNAQSIYYVSTAGSDGNDGRGWSTAKQNVQAAIDVANAGDQVWIASGTYYPTRSIDGLENDVRGKAFLLKEGVTLYGGFAGSEESVSKREMNYPDSLRNNAWNFKHITTFSADYDNVPDEWTVSVNGQWKATYNNGNGYHVVWSTSEVNGYLQATAIDGVTISGGNANHISDIRHRQAGGIYGCTGLEIRNCYIRENMAVNIGGVLNTGKTINSRISQNRATESTGGIYNAYDATMEHLIISYNSAQYDGGGIQNFGQVDACSIYGNFSNFDGGGLYNAGTVINCQIYGNQSNTNAGGIYNSGKVINSTIAANSASHNGAGIVNHFDGIVINTTVWQNNPAGGGLFAYTAVTDSVITGEGNISMSYNRPQFVCTSLATGLPGTSEKAVSFEQADWRLYKESDCIDAGISSYQGIAAPFTDYNGVKRPYANQIDIGAFEYDGTTNSPVEILNIDKQNIVFPNPFKDMLSIRNVEKGSHISLYNLTGYCVIAQQCAEEEIQLNTEHLPDGTYLLMIKNKNGINTVKLIRQH